MLGLQPRTCRLIVHRCRGDGNGDWGVGGIQIAVGAGSLYNAAGGGDRAAAPYWMSAPTRAARA